MGHTPGPWEVGEVDNEGRCAEVMANGFYVATTHDGVDSESNYEENARLIAAAPELLEALEAMADWREVIATLPSFVAKGAMLEDFDEARVAIAKATGT